MNPAQKALLEKRDGWDVGRDPRRVSRVELIAAGHKPISPLKALRARCIDCCADQPSEVRLCTAVACPSWPFRMGSNPWQAPLSAEVLEARRRGGHRTAAQRRNSSQGAGSGTERVLPATIPPADAPASRTELAVEDFEVPTTASVEPVR
jgi:hypothetical protein